jgi:hypothetical protein
MALLSANVGGPSALSRHLKLSRTTIFDYLAGRREIPRLTLNRIAVAYPCDILWLVEGVGAPPPPPSPTVLVGNATPTIAERRPRKVESPTSPEPLEVTPCRTITWKGHTYLRLEDVVELLDAFETSEETDVRNRLKALTTNLKNMKPLR